MQKQPYRLDKVEIYYYKEKLGNLLKPEQLNLLK